MGSIGADGVPRWLALDGTPLHHATVAASEMYNTRIEALLTAQLGVRFAETDAKPGKRPVREIAGIPTELIEKYSSRSAAIDHRVGQLAKQFQTAHGREPTVVEMLATSARTYLNRYAVLPGRQAVVLTTNDSAYAAEVPRLPRTLHEATLRMKESRLAHELLGEEFVDHFVCTREWEWRQFQDAVTDWELRRYFEVI